MKALQYLSPFFYNIINGMVVRPGERDPIIAALVGQEKRVFELACGTCTITKYLDRSCSYEGWDLNTTFIRYAQKQGINAKLRDIFAFEDYPESDVTLIIDVLHHVCPHHVRLLDEARKRTKRVIVAEPYTTSSFLPDFKQMNKYTGIKKAVLHLFNKTLGDYDGINANETLFSWDHDEASLTSFFKERGAQEIMKSGVSLIAVF